MTVSILIVAGISVEMIGFGTIKGDGGEWHVVKRNPFLQNDFGPDSWEDRQLGTGTICGEAVPQHPRLAGGAIAIRKTCYRRHLVNGAE